MIKVKQAESNNDTSFKICNSIILFCAVNATSNHLWLLLSLWFQFWRTAISYLFVCLWYGKGCESNLQWVQAENMMKKLGALLFWKFTKKVVRKPKKGRKETWKSLGRMYVVYHDFSLLYIRRPWTKNTWSC